MNPLTTDNYRDKDIQITEDRPNNGAPGEVDIVRMREFSQGCSDAREGMNRQEVLKNHPTEKGLELESLWTWKSDGDSVTHRLSASRGDVAEYHEIKMPRNVALSVIGDAPEKVHDFFAEIERRKATASEVVRFPSGERWRFPCGEKRYTMRRPLAPDTILDLAHDLGLAAAATIDQIEKHLHFQFQRLYQKPPDEWTDSEFSQWDCLKSYVDIEAYEAENPILENRIGVVVRISADEAAILWNTNGEAVYDTRNLPTTLLAAEEGWIVHAIIQRIANGDQKWSSSSWIEPPFKTNEQILAEEILSPTTMSFRQLPDADWPRIPRTFWRRIKTRIYELLRRCKS